MFCDDAEIATIGRMDVTQPKRIVVVGTGCSGKTTFSRALALKLQVQHIELDALYWKADWTPTPKDDFRSLVKQVVAPETWVMDGNFSVVRDITWPRATTLIWLNYPFRVVAWRALRRTFRRVFGRQVLWSGNKETFFLAFMSQDSVLWLVWKTHSKKQREYSRLLKEPENRHLQIVIFTSPEEAEKFLQTINQQ